MGVVGATWGTAGTLRERTLGVPWFLTRIQALLWSTATVLLTGLALTVQPDRA